MIANSGQKQKQMDKATTKEYQSLSRNITALLRDFQRNRQWADIGNWLSRLLPLLSAKKLPDLPNKVNLAKRLAQCLNVSLPAGVHSGALNVYNTILNNFGNKPQLLPLMSIGLFPFFQYSSSSLKLQLIKIFSLHFIQTPECLQMITSLINALLTGLNENNEQLSRKIFKLCDKIGENYGRIWVDGAVWINILKSPKVRIAGFKYFTKAFKDRDKLKENLLKQSISSFRKGSIEEEKEVSGSPGKNQEILQGGQQLMDQKNSPVKSTQKNNTQEDQYMGKTRFLSPNYQQTNKSEIACSNEEILLKKILKTTHQMEDNDKNRFPNFSTLIVNAIIECLHLPADSATNKISSDNILVKRSALDLMIFHLKLSNTDLISEKDGVQLILCILQLIKVKQYSLTRRIYTYLFGQPDMEGVYTIDRQSREYEFTLLKNGLQKMLQKYINGNSILYGGHKSSFIRRKNSTGGSISSGRKNSFTSMSKYTLMDDHQIHHSNRNNGQHSSAKDKQNETCLLIFEILIKDHPKLDAILLPPLAYSILQFLLSQSQKIAQKKIMEFYQQIIQPNSDIFLFSILNKLLSEDVLSSFKKAEQVVLTIEHFYSFKFKMGLIENEKKGREQLIKNISEKVDGEKQHAEKENNDKQDQQVTISEGQKQILSIVEWMLKYLQKIDITDPKAQKIVIQILDLSQNLIHYLSEDNRKVNAQSVSLLNHLIALKTSNSIYAGLLTLHPLPSKEMLLPFINQTSLSTVCISNLLQLSPEVFNEQEKRDIFFATFHLLNCHLWEDQAIEFIKRYRNKYEEYYFSLIDKVEPSEWLIYWKKLNGDVEGGVIRMLKNIQDENPLNRQLSKKWLEGSKHIVSKVVDPIYKVMEVISCEMLQEANEDKKQNIGTVVLEEVDQDKIMANQNEESEKKLVEKRQQIKEKKYQNAQLPPTSANPHKLKMKDIFCLIQNVFIIQKNQFIAFFFLQRDKYFIPLVQKIFQCLNSEQNQQIKTHGINMLQFLLQKAYTLDEKIAFLSLTLDRTLSLLKQTIKDEQNQNKYLRQIEILSYFRVMVDTFGSFKSGNQKIQLLKKMLNDSQMYETMTLGMKLTRVPYVRTLYMDYIHESCEVLVKITEDRKFTTNIVARVLQNLFAILRQNDITTIQQIIRGKEMASSNNRRKKSTTIINMNEVVAFDPQSAEITNVQAKYAQIIQLWNSIKFFLNLSIKNQIQDLPIQQLLSLILQSFPFSYLKYEQISRKFMQGQYEKLQEQIRNVTGLKKQVLQIFHTLWENYQQKIINVLIEKGDPRVLIHGGIDPQAVIKGIIKSQHCKKIAKFFKGTKFSLPKGILHYNTQILLQQNQLCYFLYLYIIYCNLSTIRNKKVNIFVESTLALVKSIQISSHIQTKIWILQILFSISQRIPFKDLHMQNNKVRNQFQQLLKELFDDLTPVITKSRNFTHKIQIKAGIFSIFSKEEKESSLFDFIKIFPPTIYKMEVKYNNQTKNRKIQHVFHVDDDYLLHYLFTKWLNQSEESYIRYISVIALKTYNKLFLPLLTNSFEGDLNKIANITKQNLSAMLPLCEDKSEENQIYLQNVAEFIHTLIHSVALKNQIMKSMRKGIKDIYDGNDFFKCTKNTLNHWKTIIDSLTEGSDMLGQLLSSGSLFDGIFTRKAEATRQKIKTFERVCFIIYAGRVDKYENKLRVVLQSLNQVMKSQNPSPALLILILFCIRILFMRLSETSLNRMFRSIWPSLITLLIQIFTKQVFAKNTNLLLAGLKVIELVHALELDDFNIHRWIFIFDFFGIKLDSQTEEEQQKIRDPKYILTPFQYKPILTRVLPQNCFKCEYLPETVSENGLDNRRKIIIKQASIDSDEELRNHAFVMLQNMMDLNQRRAAVVREEIEDLIQADFISLDDYIFQLK